MDEECIQMVIDYYQSKDTPYLLMLYAMSDHSDEAYEALRRLLTERHLAIPPQSSRLRSSAPRRPPVALVRARILLLIAALASLDWSTAVVALVAAMASWGRAGRCQQGAVIGTAICMVMTGVFVCNGMVFVARHDTFHRI
jgi:ferric-dicitrate binding protein FerR (iron transport regulator)